MKHLARRHPLLCFFALAYLLTWIAVPFGGFFAPGALLAALLVAALRDGTAGLRAIGGRLIRWRVGGIWYAVALAVPLGVHAVTILLNLAAGAPAPATAPFSPWYAVPLAVALNMLDPLSGPVSEEPSFRGFALPILQARRSPLVSASILAVLVTVWHAPLFFIEAFGVKPVEAVGTVAVTFWYAWLFNRAGGSALITLIAHAAEGAVNTADLWPSGADATRETWLYVAVWATVATGLVIAQRPVKRRGSSVGMPIGLTSRNGSAERWHRIG
jgi:membrane protease YdiL (CAAX protease family)